MTDYSLELAADHCVGRFRAMASPCEVLVETSDEQLADRIVAAIHAEATRIERKFSRYLPDNIVARINASRGSPVEVDAETAALLDYAGACWLLSDGRFDVTSGILRRVWRFDGSDRVPDERSINALLPLIGWGKARWEPPHLTLVDGMEVDFGGIGKEFAVDRAAAIARAFTGASVLVNFGGDLACTAPRAGDRGWIVGVEDPDAPGGGAPARPARTSLELRRGGIATSGDARRFVLRDGHRYGHILDPRTGWPVEGAPRSVTVVAPTCTEAGILATLAMLRGADAERFLDDAGVRYWSLR